MYAEYSLLNMQLLNYLVKSELIVAVSLRLDIKNNKITKGQIFAILNPKGEQHFVPQSTN